VVDAVPLADPRAARLTHYAAAAFPDALGTANAANVACRKGYLTVNGELSSGARQVHKGDALRLSLPPSRRTRVPQDADKALVFCNRRAKLLNALSDPTKQSTPLRVLYEDDCMAIVAKPAGLHTLAWAGSMASRTLCLDALLPLLLKPPPVDSCNDPLPSPLPRHRLDARVSGPVVVAKTRAALVALGRSFENAQVAKEYRALVVGRPAWRGQSRDVSSSVEIEGSAAALDCLAAAEVRALAAVSTPAAGGDAKVVLEVHRAVEGRASHTTCVVLGPGSPCAVDGWLTDLALFPRTGRRHQLRRHCAEALQTPILGDDLHDGATPLDGNESDDEGNERHEGDVSDQSDEGDEGDEGSEVGDLPGENRSSTESAALADGASRKARRRIGLFLYCRKISIAHPLEPGRVVSAQVPEPARFGRHRAKARSGWEWQQQQRELIQ
jgi:23S rRNA-/tRNA-specific pseudouridylate synthase